ncbi:hypothetical protein BDP55DRAFT_322813 [Colletotrichum godetiae]|uniref:Uncharacterized protein n=1 Tax=Colletotrichum godetiae TaxID=1209918 RepID=A0AAJ0EPW7_9PEZI|nr:uncharacterized protein BDP55DRAFT_322813 [Colletotrichum godetiae]KAK1660166.1 hypothetical protein BDP55DRAFT_322813 [Colletotrichum godetiae]
MSMPCQLGLAIFLSACVRMRPVLFVSTCIAFHLPWLYPYYLGTNVPVSKGYSEHLPRVAARDGVVIRGRTASGSWASSSVRCSDIHSPRPWLLLPGLQDSVSSAGPCGFLQALIIVTQHPGSRTRGPNFKDSSRAREQRENRVTGQAGALTAVCRLAVSMSSIMSSPMDLGKKHQGCCRPSGKGKKGSSPPLHQWSLDQYGYLPGKQDSAKQRCLPTASARRQLQRKFRKRRLIICSLPRLRLRRYFRPLPIPPFLESLSRLVWTTIPYRHPHDIHTTSTRHHKPSECI